MHKFVMLSLEEEKKVFEQKKSTSILLIGKRYENVSIITFYKFENNQTKEKTNH